MFDAPARTLRFMQRYGDDLLADIADDQMYHLPSPGLNHPAWIIGHLAYAADAHATYVGGQCHLEDWKDRFGLGTTALADASRYPEKGELIQAWHGANERLIAAVTQATPEQLAEPTQGPLGGAFPTVGEFLVFSMTGHTSLHLGQLSAWRRADGRDPLF